MGRSKPPELMARPEPEPEHVSPVPGSRPDSTGSPGTSRAGDGSEEASSLQGGLGARPACVGDSQLSKSAPVCPPPSVQTWFSKGD